MEKLFSRSIFKNKTFEVYLIEPYEIPYNDDSGDSFFINAIEYEVGKFGEMIETGRSTIF